MESTRGRRLSRVGKSCSESLCEAPVKARELCSRHYQRKKKSGELEPAFEDWTLVVASTPQPVVLGSPVLPIRFWDHIDLTDSGCWRWTRAKHHGYGVMRVGGQARALHLVTWEAFVGPRPEGLHADHTCHTLDPSCWLGDDCPHRACCNPLCIEMVPPAENAARGRNWHAEATHCPAGHPYEPPHLAYGADGYKECRTCRLKRWRDRYHRNQALLGRQSVRRVAS